MTRSWSEHKRRSILPGLVLCTLAAVLLSACSGPTPPSFPPTNSSTDSVHPTPRPSPRPTLDPIAKLTLAQRVGQLFMVGTTASAAQQPTLDLITGRHVGNIFLSGRSTAGVDATAAVVAQFRSVADSSATGNQPLLVATDQEGGKVQVLQGPGFSSIPSGVEQGQLAPTALRAEAHRWGSELAAAGVTMNLAPVVDIVSSAATAPNNPPIGAYQREFGYTAQTVLDHANAFRSGMTAANVITVMKHFPGLGYVNVNTDNASGVTDTVIGPDGQEVGIYREEIAAGARCVMVSSAVYSQIDPDAPAVFSKAIVTTLLRNRLGFTGVIMSDDLGGARQVQAWSPGDRAILAIEAGVDLVLVARHQAVAAEMVDAVLAKANSDPAFAALVDEAARRVVILKNGP